MPAEHRPPRALGIWVVLALAVTGCSGAVGKATDESLARDLRNTTHQGRGLEVFPIDTVRKAGNPSTAVTPDECSLIGQGLLPPILDGRPGAMALTPDRVNVTVVEMGSVEAADAKLAERDRVLASPACRSTTLTGGGRTQQVTVAEAPTSDHGLEAARAMTTTSPDGKAVSLLGRKGSVLVLVNSSNSAELGPVQELARSVASTIDAG